MTEAAATTATTTTTTEAWHAGLDQETLGHMTAKGWDKLQPRDAVGAAVKAFKELEHFRGIPADQIARIPKDASDEAGWNALYSRLGVPKDATGYKFDGVKFADGTDLDASLTDSIRQLATTNKLTAAQAEALTRGFVKYMDDAGSADKADAAAKLAVERDALVKNWGANFEANRFIAGQAAQKLGIDQEAVKALEGQVGYAKVMEMFRSLGKMMGEDKYVNSGAPGGTGGPMTKAEAVARKQDLMADKAWVARYVAGDAQAKREMTAINTILVS